MSSEIESLDINLLLQFQTLLSLISCISISPTYNLPIFLFGIIAIGSEPSNSGSGDRIRSFSILLLISFLLDFMWLLSSWRQGTSSIVLMLIILNFCLKPITLLSSLGNLRSRGEPTLDFSSIPGFNSLSNGGTNFNRFANGGQQANQTVWSVPGGYGRDDDEEEERVGTNNNNSGGGGNSRPTPPAKQPQPTSVGVTEGGGYHTLE